MALDALAPGTDPTAGAPLNSEDKYTERELRRDWTGARARR